eukprot:4499944-Amphidinium_carterae.1
MGNGRVHWSFPNQFMTRRGGVIHPWHHVSDMLLLVSIVLHKFRCQLDMATSTDIDGLQLPAIKHK